MMNAKSQKNLLVIKQDRFGCNLSVHPTNVALLDFTSDHFLHACILGENVLFYTLILGSDFSDYVVF